MKRFTKDQVFIEMAEKLALRASCGRLSVGALIVAQTKHIITSGVNGPNAWDCDELKCDTSKPCQYAIHAEDNAIRYALLNNIPLKGTTLYCTHMPCFACAELIIKAGISRVVYGHAYRSTAGVELLNQNNISTCHYYALPQP